MRVWWYRITCSSRSWDCFDHWNTDGTLSLVNTVQPLLNFWEYLLNILMQISNAKLAIEEKRISWVFPKFKADSEVQIWLYLSCYITLVSRDKKREKKKDGKKERREGRRWERGGKGRISLLVFIFSDEYKVDTLLFIKWEHLKGLISDPSCSHKHFLSDVTCIRRGLKLNSILYFNGVTATK